MHACAVVGQRDGVGDDHFVELRRRWMRSIAGPENTGCVQYAKTFFAPRSFSTSAAFTSVPAVSIMSSMITQLRPSISPMTCITSRHVGLRAALVDDRQVAVQLLGQRPGAHHAADVRRDHEQVVVVLADCRSPSSTGDA